MSLDGDDKEVFSEQTIDYFVQLAAQAETISLSMKISVPEAMRVLMKSVQASQREQTVIREANRRAGKDRNLKLVTP